MRHSLKTHIRYYRQWIVEAGTEAAVDAAIQSLAEVN